MLLPRLLPASRVCTKFCHPDSILARRLFQRLVSPWDHLDLQLWRKREYRWNRAWKFVLFAPLRSIKMSFDSTLISSPRNETGYYIKSNWRVAIPLLCQPNNQPYSIMCISLWISSSLSIWISNTTGTNDVYTVAFGYIFNGELEHCKGESIAYLENQWPWQLVLHLYLFSMQ